MYNFDPKCSDTSKMNSDSNAAPKGFSRPKRMTMNGNEGPSTETRVINNTEPILVISDDDGDNVGNINRNSKPFEYNQQTIKLEIEPDPQRTIHNNLSPNQSMNGSDAASEANNSFINITQILCQQMEQFKCEILAKMIEKQNEFTAKQNEMIAKQNEMTEKMYSLEREMKQANQKRQRSRSRSHEQDKRTKSTNEMNNSRRMSLDKSNQNRSR